MTSSKAIRLGVVIQIDVCQCVGCAICADVCTTGSLRMGPEALLPDWTAENCSACADCFRECPTGAVRVGRQQMDRAAEIVRGGLDPHVKLQPTD